MAQRWPPAAPRTALLTLGLLAVIGLAFQGSANALQSSDTSAQAYRALAFQRAGDLDKALAVYGALDTAAKEQHKALPSAVLANYARALAATGKLDQAAVEMKAASVADPRNATIEDDLGSIYARQQRWAEAQPEFAAAARLNPGMAVAHLHLGSPCRRRAIQRAFMSWHAPQS